MIDWLGTHWTEVLGFVTGLVCVALATRRNVWNYPVGLANNAVFLVLFVSTGLYATAGLQVVFGALAIHGWVRWVRGEEADADYVARTPRRQVPGLVLVGLALCGALAWILATFTDSTVALADAATTAGSLVAQYLLNRKRIETWFVWIAVDIGFIVLAAATGLWITAALYVVFTVLCVYGWRSWLAVERRAARVQGERGTRAEPAPHG